MRSISSKWPGASSSKINQSYSPPLSSLPPSTEAKQIKLQNKIGTWETQLYYQARLKSLRREANLLVSCTFLVLVKKISILSPRLHLPRALHYFAFVCLFVFRRGLPPPFFCLIVHVRTAAAACARVMWKCRVPFPRRWNGILARNCEIIIVKQWTPARVKTSWRAARAGRRAALLHVKKRSSRFIFSVYHHSPVNKGKLPFFFNCQICNRRRRRRGGTFALHMSASCPILLSLINQNCVKNNNFVLMIHFFLSSMKKVYNFSKQNKNQSTLLFLEKLRISKFNCKNLLCKNLL